MRCGEVVLWRLRERFRLFFFLLGDLVGLGEAVFLWLGEVFLLSDSRGAVGVSCGGGGVVRRAGGVGTWGAVGVDCGGCGAARRACGGGT